MVLRVHAYVTGTVLNTIILLDTAFKNMLQYNRSYSYPIDMLRAFGRNLPSPPGPNLLDVAYTATRLKAARLRPAKHPVKDDVPCLVEACPRPRCSHSRKKTNFHLCIGDRETQRGEDEAGKHPLLHAPSLNNPEREQAHHIFCQHHPEKFRVKT